MVLFDRLLKKGNLDSIELLTGKNYTVTFDVAFKNFSKPKNNIIDFYGKKAEIISISKNSENSDYTDVQVTIPETNPFPFLILGYALAALFAGLGVYLATSNIVRVTEDITKPSGLTALLIIAFLYFKITQK